MKKLNREQRVARSLYYLNNFIGILTMIPAVWCWVITVLVISETHSIDAASFYFLGASILLVTFYGYIFRCPCIHKVEKYNKEISFWYWRIVLLTNLLTILLFVTTHFKGLALIPFVPLVFSVIGLDAYYSKEESIKNI
jgi:hypothetical protein